MRISIPGHLTDTRTRGFFVLQRGDRLGYLEMILAVEERKESYLDEHSWLRLKPAFRFDGSELVAASDGSPRPAYDIRVLWSHDKTPDELAEQEAARRAYVAQRELDIVEREASQKSILNAVIADIQEKMHRT